MAAGFNVESGLPRMNQSSTASVKKEKFAKMAQQVRAP